MIEMAVTEVLGQASGSFTVSKLQSLVRICLHRMLPSCHVPAIANVQRRNVIVKIVSEEKKGNQ